MLTIDRALKDIEAHFPGVKVKAIHDDITLIGPPEMIFGEDKSMMFLEKRLKLKGLTVNRGKCAVLGTTPDACKDKPDWLTEPTTIMDKNGTLFQARGIEVCKTPITIRPYTSREEVQRHPQCDYQK